jgi:CubicO group peptidase (beta-lactamase class C family)
MDLLLDFFSEYKDIAYSGSEKITIQHLLQMSSGRMSPDFSQYNSRDRFDMVEIVNPQWNTC